MNIAGITRNAAIVLFLSGVTSSASLQVSSSPGVELPASFRLSEVEIGLVAGGGGGGCVGRCVIYRITIRGNGVVSCEDIGTPPRAELLPRTVPVDEVVSLVNEFLKVRFFEAFDRYDTVDFVVRQGDLLLRRSSGAIDRGTADITMKLGSRAKTVVLSENVPAELGRLRDLTWRMGAPTCGR
jgi:hypothetical protein